MEDLFDDIEVEDTDDDLWVETSGPTVRLDGLTVRQQNARWFRIREEQAA